MNDGPSLTERPELVTKRLSLRRSNDGDADITVSILGDLGGCASARACPAPYGPADARFFLEQVLPVNGCGP